MTMFSQISYSLHIILPIWFLMCYFVHSHNEETLSRSTYIIHMDKSLMPSIFTNHHNWYIHTVDSLKSTTSNGSKPTTSFSSPKILYSYDNALHGFSASLTKNELENLKTHPAFISSYEESKGTLDTTRTIDFLSLNSEAGLWPASNYGKDIIIGVIDTGIWPESRSFSDSGMTQVPPRWKGACLGGENFNTSMCNRKLIGVRYFNKGLLAVDPEFKDTANSVRDTDGHGTHTSSTTVGSFVDDVSFFGYAKGTARGVAPRARLSIYKVVWGEECYTSDVLAAMDQAISDGVDVISISLGFDNIPLYKNPVAIGSFSAMDRGIFVSTSAGNAGPIYGSTHNDIPWALTVSASTIDRQFAGTLTLGNGKSILGWTLFPASAILQKVPLTYNPRLAMCNSSQHLGKIDPYQIIICDDHNNTIDQMGYISISSNIAGAIFICDDPLIYEAGQMSWPGIVVSSKDGELIKNYAKMVKNNSWVTMEFQQTILGSKNAPLVASYTSRGPSKSVPSVLKPDIMAPGTQVLAAYPPSAVIANIGLHISLSSDYALLSGTSMACPHASGVGALLRGTHPDWTPAAIRSAMMTTANPRDSTGGLIKDNGMNLRPGSPLAMGSGQVDPNRALDPGLVYDLETQDYVNLLCSMNFSMNQIRTIVRSNKHDCSTPSNDLNYPSFIAYYNPNTTTSTITFHRTLTNVGGNGRKTYMAMINPPKGSNVQIFPRKLMFKKQYEKQSYNLTLKYKNVGKLGVTFGSLVWAENNGKHSVRSPIVISPPVNLLPST